MGFVNGLLKGVEYQKAQWIGPDIIPEIVILHDTASPIKKGSAAAYLRENSAKVSVQFVIERDGTIIQQVPVGKRANHAGKSVYHGREWCNGFSVGIEIVNPGKMSWVNDRKVRAWWGQEFDVEDFGIERVATIAHGSGWWMPYTEAQLEAVIRLLQDLFASYDTLMDVTTHWYVSPGRKVDTNPLFPLDHIKAFVMGRDDPVDIAVLQDAVDVSSGEMVQTNTPGDTLNLRRWPSFNPNILTAIPHDTVLPVLRRGVYEGRDWLCVVYGGHEGWIVASYADPVTFQEKAS